MLLRLDSPDLHISNFKISGVSDSLCPTGDVIDSFLNLFTMVIEPLCVKLHKNANEHKRNCIKYGGLQRSLGWGCTYIDIDIYWSGAHALQWKVRPFRGLMNLSDSQFIKKLFLSLWSKFVARPRCHPTLRSQVWSVVPVSFEVRLYCTKTVKETI